MSMFIGRKKELKELNFRFNNSKKEFGVIYGRRRIGKSTLINEFLKDKPNIFFQAKKDSLRSLNSEGEITDEEYDYCLEHWDEILLDWESQI